MKIFIPSPITLLLIYIFYLFLRMILKTIRFRAEKLEELGGEFIFTFIKRIRKKEIYFNIDEVRMVTLTRMLIRKGTFQIMNINILLKDGYLLQLKKKYECLLFLQTCREKRKGLYEKILNTMPIGTRIIEIIEKDLDNFKR